MDKFGIFKILNSFLNLYTQNSSSGAGDGDSKSPPNFLDGLKNILNSNAPNTNPREFPLQAPNNQPAKSADKGNTTPPLQANMLYTMRSHDEFVKRVNQGTKK